MTLRPPGNTPSFSQPAWIVDRMASAWLIRRFIDPEATFTFAERIPQNDELVPFDMFGVEFGHRGDLCTYETLMRAFGVAEAAVARIARIVHALDLRDAAPTDSETITIGRLVAGLRHANAADEALLERGMSLFDALYHSFRSETAD